MKSFNALLADSTVYKENLPYERFLKHGEKSLSDAELLAIIIRTGSSRNSPLDIAKQVLELGRGKEKGLNCLYNLSIEELQKIHGIGQIKAVKLKCLAELAMRMSVQRAGNGISFRDSRAVAEFYMEKLRHEDKENAILLCFNSRGRLLEEHVLSVGTVDCAMLSPRDVFIYALKCGASSMIILHNHPSGDPTPSKADVAITNRIRESGIMLDIILKDHIIIGDMTYYSFKEKGLFWH